MFSHSRKQPDGRSSAPSPWATEDPHPSLLGFMLSRTRLVERLRRILLKAQARKRKLA